MNDQERLALIPNRAEAERHLHDNPYGHGGKCPFGFDHLDNRPRDWIDRLTLPEAARSLGVAPATLRQQVRNGKLAARKVSRDWYVQEAEVERYRAEHLRVKE